MQSLFFNRSWVSRTVWVKKHQPDMFFFSLEIVTHRLSFLSGVICLANISMYSLIKNHNNTDKKYPGQAKINLYYIITYLTKDVGQRLDYVLTS